MKEVKKTFFIFCVFLWASQVQLCSLKCNPMISIDSCDMRKGGYVPECECCYSDKKYCEYPKEYLVGRNDYVVKEPKRPYYYDACGLPEVHVETSTPSFQCATQAYEVPKKDCGHVLPQQSTTVIQPQNCPMHYPYPYHPAPAPSYCVQSVVVGGSKVDDKKEESCKKNGNGMSRGVERAPKGNGDPGGDPSGALDPPVEASGDLKGDPSGDPSAGLTGVGDPNSGGDPSSKSGRCCCGCNGRNRTCEDRCRYEKYIEKILEVVKDKLGPECDCCEPCPMVVVPEPRMRVKTVRRCRQKKYRLQEPEPVVVVEEEEEEEPSYVVHRPRCYPSYPCSRSCCRCRNMCRCYE